MEFCFRCGAEVKEDDAGAHQSTGDADRTACAVCWALIMTAKETWEASFAAVPAPCSACSELITRVRMLEAELDTARERVKTLGAECRQAHMDRLGMEHVRKHLFEALRLLPPGPPGK